MYLMKVILFDEVCRFFLTNV